VDGVQRSRERLAGLHQVAQVGARVAAANHALAGGIGRVLIFRIAFGLDIQPPLACEEKPMAGGARRQHAVHHVHAHAGVLLDLVGVAHAHQVTGLVRGQQRQHLGDGLLRQFARLAHAQATDGIAVEIHLNQPLRALAAQIFIGTALHDAKEALLAALEFVAPRHFFAVGTKVIQRPPRPGHGEPETLLRPGTLCWIFGALVEGHGDVGAEGDLHVHGVLGSEEVAAAVQMGAKAHALVADLAQLAQAEDLKAAGIGEHGARPADELVQPAHAADRLVARTQVEVIGVA